MSSCRVWRSSAAVLVARLRQFDQAIAEVTGAIADNDALTTNLVLDCINKRYIARRVPPHGDIANLCNRALANSAV